MAVQVIVALAVALAGLGFMLLTATLVRSRSKTGSAGPSGARVVTTRPASAEPGPPPPIVAPPVPDSPEVEVNRRMFLNRAMLLAMSVFGVAFGGAILANLWSNKTGGFGSLITVRRSDVEEALRLDNRYYNPEGRFYIVRYDTSDPTNRYVEAGVAKEGLMVLYQKCAHLGCRVPFCPTSQWFECPCHGSKYNYAGEVMPGSPAPAGLWRFPIMEINDQQIIIDTANDSAQPESGVDTIRRPPAGAHCIGAAEGAGH